MSIEYIVSIHVGLFMMLNWVHVRVNFVMGMQRCRDGSMNRFYSPRR